MCFRSPEASTPLLQSRMSSIQYSLSIACMPNVYLIIFQDVKLAFVDLASAVLVQILLMKIEKHTGFLSL